MEPVWAWSMLLTDVVPCCAVLWMRVVPRQFGEAGPTVDKRKVWVIARQHPGERHTAALFAV